MRVIAPRAHGWLDLAMVVVFFAGPSIFGLTGTAATLSYALGVIHLAMTLLTDKMPIALSSAVPLPLHGLVEAGVGVLLGLLGLFAFDGDAQTFFLVVAAVILLGFALTSYTDTQ